MKEDEVGERAVLAFGRNPGEVGVSGGDVGLIAGAALNKFCVGA